MIRFLSFKNLMSFIVSCALIFGCSVTFAAEEVDYQKIAKDVQKEVAKALKKASEEVEKVDVDKIMKEVQKALVEGLKQIEDIDIDDIMDEVERNLEKGLEKLDDIDFDDMAGKIERNIEKHLEHLPKHLEKLEHLGEKIERNLNKHLASLNAPHSTGHSIDTAQTVEELEKKFKGKIAKKKTFETYAVQDGTELVVDTIFSSINVTSGRNDEEIKIAVEQIAGGDTDAIARNILDKMKLTLKQSRGTVSIQIQIEKDKSDKDKKEKNKNTMMKNIITVQVPENSPVRIKNSFGDVSVKGVGGTVDCNNSFGGTFLSETDDELNVTSMYGKLEITGHDGKGIINNQFGDLIINGWTDPIDLKASYSKTKIKGLEEDAVLRGNINFGEIVVEIPDDFSGQVEAVSSFGEISVPREIKKKKDMFNESAKGSIGSGDGLIQIKSSYAPVKIVME